MFSFTSSLMPCVCMFWTYKHVLMLYLHPWRLWTQRVTKMWQTEVSEGQKEARIMSSLPPWGMTMCSCESTWTLLEYRNKQCFMAKRLHWFSGNFMVTVKLELVIAPGQEIEQHKKLVFTVRPLSGSYKMSQLTPINTADWPIRHGSIMKQVDHLWVNSHSLWQNSAPWNERQIIYAYSG